VGDRGPDQATPDIAAVIQEIVNQDGWASGNALVLIISDDPANPSQGIRCAEAGPGDDAALLTIEYTEPPPEPGANIIWVAITQDHDMDGVQDDQAWIDWLVAENHTVDVRLDYWGELDLEPNKVDELNAADLVIFSRTTSSGHHDDGDEPTLWNSVTTPIILMNAYLVRTNRWLWMDTTTINKADDIMMASDPTHPLFDGVTLEMGTMVLFRDNTVGEGITSFVGSSDVGNGTLIAQRLSADGAWIAEWAPCVEFFPGSGQIAGGPRMLFTAGTQEEDGPPPTPYGAWDLTAEGEKMFRNAIAHMIAATPPPPPPPKLVAHWQLDEGSGTIAADSSGNGLDGTLMGDPLWVPGIICGTGALEFDGVDDNVDCGNPSALDFGTGDWTISAWINATEAATLVPDDSTIVGKGGDHSGGIRYQIMLDSSDYIHPVVDDDSSKYDPHGEIPVIDGQWHLIVMMRRNGTELRVYVDGVEDMGVTNHSESTLPCTYDLSGTSQHNAYIGAITDARDPNGATLEKLFVGTIDDVRVYNYALSEAEIADLIPLETPGLVERRIADSSDDAEERDHDDGYEVELDSSDLELAWEDWMQGDKQVVGLRFTDITIPMGTKIKKAWVQFEVDETKGGTYPVFLIIDGELSANAATFSKDARDISSRPRTITGAWWDVPDWIVKGEQGPAQRTPDISDIIQEIVDQPDWASCNSLVLILEQGYSRYISTGVRCAESFDGKAEAAPLLHIEHAYEETTLPPRPEPAPPPEPEPTPPPEPEPTPPPEPEPTPPEHGDWDAGKMESLTSSDLEIPYEDTGMGEIQIIGLRYTNVTIPKGATITSASVQFQVDEDKDGTLPVNLVIEGDLSADAAAFANVAYSVTSRPRTTALVQWSVPNWITVGDRGPDQATPDISAVIQEIVNQDGWASGNALALIISDDPANPSQGIRCAEAGPGDDAALLRIEYVAP
jgi:hypothetical protein